MVVGACPHGCKSGPGPLEDCLMMPAPALCPYPEPPARTGVVYAFPRAAPEPSITGGLPMLASGLVELLEGINAPRRRLRR